MATPSSSNKTVAASVAVVLIAVATVSRVWVEVASHYVPEPYLVSVHLVSPQHQMNILTAVLFIGRSFPRSTSPEVLRWKIWRMG